MNSCLSPWSRVTEKSVSQSKCSVPLVPGVHYCIHRSWPLDLVLSQMNSVHALTTYFLLCSHVYLGLPSGLFCSCFLTKILYTFLISPMCATCPVHLILLDMITITIVVKHTSYVKLLIMQFSSASHHFRPLRSKYPPQHPVLKHPQSVFLPWCESPSFTPTQKTGKIIVMYIVSFSSQR